MKIITMKNAVALTGIIIIILLLTGCAKVGAPTGGIRDNTPPKYITGTPENRSTQFKGKEITFSFDEYIQFKDLNKELLVSPPMKDKPNVRIRDKSVRITMMNDLLPATTYTVNFGNALSDLNEGNPLPDFEFVFSTGDQIDSLAITGKALNAFDHMPLKDEEILVLLHEDLSDSAPLLKLPRYIGRASSNGLFAINNIHADTIRIFALNDVNGNLKYDPGYESMAFLDTFVIMNANTVTPQIFIKDTIMMKPPEKRGEQTGKKVAVKSQIDTTIVQGKKMNALNVNLYYFLEETDDIFLTTKKRELPEKLFFIFSRAPHDSILVKPLNYKPGLTWFVKESNMNRDSLTYWITDSLMAKKDTLLMAVSYTSTDSSHQFVWRTDTIRMRYQVTTEKSSGRKTRATIINNSARKLTVSASIANKGVQNLNKPVLFTSDKPILRINQDSIELYSIADSVSTRESFTCLTDTSHLREFRLAAAWKENTQYHLLLKPGALKDIFAQQNDSVEIRFTTQKTEYYGRIMISASGNHFPVILQVIDQKGRIVDTRKMKQPDKIIIDYLPPDKYSLKAIVDSNQNGRWDTGNYLKHRQPEPVFFYKLPIELRSNWDYEVIWEIPD